MFSIQMRNSANGLLALALVFSPALALSATPFHQNSAAPSAQSAPNAGDQKNDKADVKLAAHIRRAIVKDKSLSTRAHNVTIIVKGGTVTLRGEVDSDQEKQAVHAKAQQIAGSATIDDMLTVKQK